MDNKPFEEQTPPEENAIGHNIEQIALTSDEANKTETITPEREKPQDLKENFQHGPVDSPPGNIDLPLNITKVHVIFPKLVEKFFGSYMEYRITFLEGGAPREVIRRYSDIEELRKNLRFLLPGILIFPLHPKKFFGSNENDYQIDRVQELNAFFSFLTASPHIFNQQVIRNFFDSNLNSTNLGIVNSRVNRPVIEELLVKYKNLYPESRDLQIDLEMRDELVRFKEKVDVNIEFYNRFKDVAGDLKNKTDKYKSASTEDYDSFNEMLQITFSREEEKVEMMQEIFKSMKGNSDVEGYRFWENKLAMLSLELETYNEIYKDLQSLEQLYDRRLSGLNSANQEIEKLNNQPEQPQTQQRLTQLREEITIHDSKGRSAYAIMGLLIHKIVKNDINYLKERKRERFNFIISTYSRMKIESLNNEIDYWNKVADFSNTRQTNLESIIKKRKPTASESPQNRDQQNNGEIRDDKN